MATAKTLKSLSDDARTRRTGSGSSPSREPRSVSADEQRTQLDGTGVSRADRLRMIQDEFRQEALPNPPEIPGWHLCWLSTTSTYDPISKRQRLGYEPVHASEMPGFNADRMSSGAFQDSVSCNEMVLFKIPLDIYNMIMKEFHHDQPLREEENLRQNLSRGQQDSEGKPLDKVEGFEDLGVKRAAPHFA